MNFVISSRDLFKKKNIDMTFKSKGLYFVTIKSKQAN
mgnify:CR=1 FL=1